MKRAEVRDITNRSALPLGAVLACEPMGAEDAWQDSQISRMRRVDVGHRGLLLRPQVQSTTNQQPNGNTFMGCGIRLPGILNS